MQRLWLRRPGLNSRPVYVGFVVDKVALGTRFVVDSDAGNRICCGQSCAGNRICCGQSGNGNRICCGQSGTVNRIWCGQSGTVNRIFYGQSGTGDRIFCGQSATGNRICCEQSGTGNRISPSISVPQCQNHFTHSSYITDAKISATDSVVKQHNLNLKRDAQTDTTYRFPCKSLVPPEISVGAKRGTDANGLPYLP